MGHYLYIVHIKINDSGEEKKMYIYRQMFFRNLYLAAHRYLLAGIFTVRMRIAFSIEYLIINAFPIYTYKISLKMHN